MGKLIKYGLYAIALNWLVAIFLYLMGRITLSLPMRIVIDEAALQFNPITWVHVTVLTTVTAIGALLVYEILYRRYEEDAFRYFFYLSIAVLALSLIPIYTSPFSWRGTYIVLTMIHVACAFTLLGVIRAYQDNRT